MDSVWASDDVDGFLHLFHCVSPELCDATPISPNFRRAVLGCTDSYDSNQILIFQDFRDLQDIHTFAPLRSQNFSKKVVTILSFLNILNNLFIQIFMKNALKLVFFFEILMKFCRNFTNIFRKCKHLRRIAENSEKLAKILSKSRNSY